MPHSSYHPMIIALLVIVVSALAFIPGIASLPPLDSPIAGVEAGNAQTAKQFLDNGGLPTNPYHWLQAGLAYILGDHAMLAYRLPSLLAGFAVLGLGFIFARTLLPLAHAAIATVLLGTVLILVAMSHFAAADTLLCASILAQQFALWRIYEAHTNDRYVSGRWAVMLWLAMALGIITGGVVTVGVVTVGVVTVGIFTAPIIALLTVSAFVLITRQARWLLAARPILGFVLLTAVILPWVILSDGLFIPGEEASTLPASANLPIPYLPLLVIILWPASLLLVRGVIMLWRRHREPQILFLISWIVPYMLVLEATPEKLPQYLLPIAPALVILAGLGLQTVPPPPSPTARGWIKNLNLGRLIIVLWDGVFIAVSLVLGITVLYYASIFDGAREWGAVALVLSIVIAVLAWRWHRHQKPVALIAIALTAAAFHATVFGGVLPSLDAIHIAPRLKSEIDAIAPRPGAIALVGYHAPSAVFALGSDALLFDAKNAALFLAESPGGLSSGGLAVVEKRQIADFLATAQKANIATSLEGGISGIDSMTGQTVELQFYRLADGHGG